jgi:hypothetical protein
MDLGDQVDFDRLTCLTPQREAAVFWTAIAAGAKGINYWTVRLRQPSRGFSVPPELQEQTRRQNAQVATLWPALTAPNIKSKVPYGSPLRIGAHRYKGVTYIVAVNTGDKPVKARFAAAGIGVRKAVVWQEGRSLKAKANAITDRFKPYGVHIYVVQ